MGILKYETALAMDAAAVAKLNIPLQVRKQSARLDLEIVKLEGDKADLESNLLALNCQADLQFNEIVNTLNRLEVASKNLASLGQLKIDLGFAPAAK